VWWTRSVLWPKRPVGRTQLSPFISRHP